MEQEAETAKAKRLMNAVLQNMEDWRDRTLQIADLAHPATGNKARALSLARDLEQCRLSLQRLIGMASDEA